ncbi:unnamed protein product [Brachionus calyciflorus]|uniref:Cyanophycinase n=1 Tax=Brachionus calyciflorus TaxID=104777 RepID=A0A814AS44_9BILA|nr:unnamed protein product [Brachionus calyciflorus]
MNSNSDINGSLSALRKSSISQQKDQNSNLVFEIHSQSYQMNLAFKQEIVRKKRENVIKKLEEKFPKEFALIYCGLMFFLGVCLIILQSFNSGEFYNQLRLEELIQTYDPDPQQDLNSDFEHFVLIMHKLYLCADYHSWIVGNPGDFKLADESVLDGGILLAGGSIDQDEAYRWFLTRARGGDVIVIREGKDQSYDQNPNNDAYNKYFYSDLGVPVDSVETIFLNSKTVANSQEVAKKIREAEAIFFTGGDQSYYYKYIDNTLFQDALDYAIEVKKVVVGGTSAGCAIQGEFGYTAEVGSVVTSEALADPYDSRLTFSRNLLRHPILKNTITDTHYNERGRQGRHIAFMARVLKDSLSLNSIVRGIGVDEQTVVCIESSGLARVFGNRDAYFLQQNSQQGTPETCQSRKKLDWYRSREAIRVYKITGTQTGDRHFDLNTWNRGYGGKWYFMYIDQGRYFNYLA